MNSDKDNIRRYWSANDADDETKIKKNIKGSFIALAVVFIMFGIANPSDEELKENERISSMSSGEKQLYEQKFTEYTKSMSEDDARAKAIADVDANTAANEKLIAMNDEDIKMTDKKFARLISPKEWQARRDLKDAAQRLMHAIGAEVFMDYNEFAARISREAKLLRLSASAAQLKTIARAMSETDPEAKPVVKKEHRLSSKDIETLVNTYGISEGLLPSYGFDPTAKGTYLEYESDSALRDTEKIPVKEEIYDYFQHEVYPYVPDAWINLTAKKPSTMIGCEISFNKYFYKPAPLRTLEENERDIRQLDAESQGFIQSLFNDL